MEEGGDFTPSKLALGKAKFELHKIGVFVKATDELLEDAASLNSYMLDSAPDAINYKMNSAIISGDGVGKPAGLLNSGFKVQVAKEVGQTADTIVYKNLLKMKARFLSQSGGIWIAHPQAREQLMTTTTWCI
jgi:HK97 family phage major capsid protein